MQQVLRPQAEAGVVLAGVAAEPGRVMDCPVHHQPDPALRVIGQAQHAGRAGGAAEHGLHQLRRGEGEAGGAQLGAEDLGLEGLAAGHGQQVERRLLPVAEKSRFHKEQAYQNFVARINSTDKKIKNRTFPLRKVFYYAACVLFIFMAGIGTQYLFERFQDKELLTYSLEAPRKAKVKMSLPDGSLVWLNAASTLCYNNEFGVSNRDLTLQGEGYFEISKNPELPLIVTSGNVKVRVLGTKFNVQNYQDDDEIRVALLEGSIDFSDSRYDKSIVMKPNQLITCNKRTGVLTLKDINAEYANSWIYDDVFFNEEKLGTIAKVLERAFDVTIHFENDDLKNLIFYGDITIEADNIVQIMDIMAATNKFNYRYDMDKKEIRIYH